MPSKRAREATNNSRMDRNYQATFQNGPCVPGLHIGKLHNPVSPPRPEWSKRKRKNRGGREKAGKREKKGRTEKKRDKGARLVSSLQQRFERHANQAASTDIGVDRESGRGISMEK